MCMNLGPRVKSLHHLLTSDLFSRSLYLQRGAYNFLYNTLQIGSKEYTTNARSRKSPTWPIRSVQYKVDAPLRHRSRCLSRIPKPIFKEPVLRNTFAPLGLRVRRHTTLLNPGEVFIHDWAPRTPRRFSRIDARPIALFIVSFA